jgi:hypothetical protein
MTVTDILMPGGQPIGVRGTGRRANARLREVKGTAVDAEAMFKDLIAFPGATDITPPGYLGKLFQIPGGVVGYRPASKNSGPPPIDVNIPGIPIDKVKFVP